MPCGRFHQCGETKGRMEKRIAYEWYRSGSTASLPRTHASVPFLESIQKLQRSILEDFFLSHSPLLPLPSWTEHCLEDVFDNITLYIILRQGHTKDHDMERSNKAQDQQLCNVRLRAHKSPCSQSKEKKDGKKALEPGGRFERKEHGLSTSKPNPAQPHSQQEHCVAEA